MFASQALAVEIDEGAAAGKASIEHRVGLLRGHIDHFTSGGLLTVGYRHEKHCLFKPLEPVDDEVWELRSRDPNPALRVFGRFAMRNAFVATHWARRDELGGWGARDWAAKIRRCKTIWRQLFFTYPPVTGVSINDYLSNVIEIGDLP